MKQHFYIPYKYMPPYLGISNMAVLFMLTRDYPRYVWLWSVLWFLLGLNTLAGLLKVVIYQSRTPKFVETEHGR